MKDRKLLRAIEGARNGDDEAFGELMRLRNKNMLYIATKLLKDPKDGEDAAQEAALHIKENIAKLEDPELFDTWMYRIVYNACMDERRGRKGEGENEEISSYESILPESREEFLPEAYAMREAKRRELLSAIDRLPKSYRMGLLMFYYQEMSYAQIAEVLDMGVQDVASMLSRAKKKLRTLLADDRQRADVPQAPEPDQPALAPALASAGAGLGGAPVITQVFGYDEEQVVTPEMVARFNSAVLPGIAAVAVEGSRRGSGLAPKIAAAMAGVALLFGIGAAMAATLDIFDGGQGAAPGSGSSQGGESGWLADPGENPLSDVLESPEEQELLEGFASGENAIGQWEDAADELGLAYKGHFLSDGSRYTVYSKPSPDGTTQLVVIERMDAANNITVAFTVGKAREAVPQGLESVQAFEAWST